MSYTEKNQDPKWNLTVAPMWETAGGNFVSIEISDEIFDAIQRVGRGGKLFVKKLKAEHRKQENSPHAYLEFMSPENVREFRAKQEQMANETATPQAAPVEIL